MDSYLKQNFPGYHLPSESELKKGWTDAILVLDTNILINLYRYPEKARDDLLKVLETLKAKLWIPFHVALEYQRNRLDVIAEQNKKYNEVKNTLEKYTSDLKSKIENLQLTKRHSSINADRLIEGIESQVKKFLLQLERLQEKQMSPTDHDNIRDNIGDLIEGNIGDPPKNQEELDQIFKDGEIRYSLKYPPGFKDTHKEDQNDAFFYGGLRYRQLYGDLIIWKQILLKAKESALTSIIFLTDDEKQDWWWIIDSNGKKKIGPRPELVDEIRRESGVLFFHMYNSEQFLRYAKKYLNADISDESITKIQDIARSQTLSTALGMDEAQLLSRLSAMKWIEEQYPTSKILLSQNEVMDCLVIKGDDKIAFKIEYIYSYTKFLLSMSKYRKFAEERVTFLNISEMILIITLTDRDLFGQIHESVRLISQKLPAHFRVIIAIIDTDTEKQFSFKPLVEIDKDTRL
jgi:hypothetical protein